MREIRPYKTVRGARKALDNGGRFFNLFARADDDVVDPAELAKAAGVYSSGMKALLFFEMALMGLSSDERTEVTGLLSPELRTRYAAQRPRILAPSAVESEGQAGLPAIVSGYPVFVENRSEFRGFIVIVVHVAVVLLPIIDQFDVYEVFDTPDLREPKTVIATTRGSRRLEGVYARFGGVLKELYFDDKTGKAHGLYLEAMYYARET
jgi:hypothetical protein